MHVRCGSSLQMASSARSARARSDVARGSAEYFASIHACPVWLPHEYLHPTGSSTMAIPTRRSEGSRWSRVRSCQGSNTPVRCGALPMAVHKRASEDLASGRRPPRRTFQPARKNAPTRRPPSTPCAPITSTRSALPACCGGTPASGLTPGIRLIKLYRTV
jgi:hypothetical protein